MGSVAALLAMDRTTLTANLKPLEKRGWVETSVDPKDRRSRLLRLTDAGAGVLQSAMPIWLATHGQIDAELSHLDSAALRAGLQALA